MGNHFCLVTIATERPFLLGDHFCWRTTIAGGPFVLGEGMGGWKGCGPACCEGDEGMERSFLHLGNGGLEAKHSLAR